MKLTSVDATLPDFHSDSHERTEGLHLGHILDLIEKDMGVDYSSHPWDSHTTMNVGFIWERVLKDSILRAQVEAGEIIQIGEVIQDGILMTPDAINTTNGSVEEWKFTWKSINRDIASFYRYWWQIKSYCLACHTRTATLRVLFAMGDWKNSPGPQYRVWRAEFSEQELEENWKMILGHKP